MAFSALCHFALWLVRLLAFSPSGAFASWLDASWLIHPLTLDDLPPVEQYIGLLQTNILCFCVFVYRMTKLQCIVTELISRPNYLN